MRDDLLRLIDSIEEVEKRFHSIEGGFMEGFEFIHDVPEFIEWREELKIELQFAYDKTKSAPILNAIKKCNSRMNGSNDRQLFEELSALLHGIEKNIDNIYPSEENTKEKKSTTSIEVKRPMVFISHASADKRSVELIVDLLSSINLIPRQDIFCSSMPGYDIPIGEDIYGYLRDLFRSRSLHVLFVHSPKYYESNICLNEMGAAWVLKTKVTSFLLPGFDFSEMTGVVDSRSISIKLDSEEQEVRDKLNQFRSVLSQDFSIPDTSTVVWEKARDTFIEEINRIEY